MMRLVPRSRWLSAGSVDMERELLTAIDDARAERG